MQVYVHLVSVPSFQLLVPLPDTASLQEALEVIVQHINQHLSKNELPVPQREPQCYQLRVPDGLGRLQKGKEYIILDDGGPLKGQLTLPYMVGVVVDPAVLRAEKQALIAAERDREAQLISELRTKREANVLAIEQRRTEADLRRLAACVAVEQRRTEEKESCGRLSEARRNDRRCTVRKQKAEELERQRAAEQVVAEQREKEWHDRLYREMRELRALRDGEEVQRDRTQEEEEKEWQALCHAAAEGFRAIERASRCKQSAQLLIADLHQTISTGGKLREQRELWEMKRRTEERERWEHRERARVAEIARRAKTEEDRLRRAHLKQRHLLNTLHLARVAADGSHPWPGRGERALMLPPQVPF
eukprot:Sspe_Gene.71195::Locus_42161_Transcript_1_1_Confidence_1.000_Length_1599::g.71195::m.71195